MARRPAPLGLLLIALVSVCASVARTLVGGQDLNFDLQTYHYYLGYSAFVDRFALDYLAASFQGYQSPLPYVLLYWLDSVATPPFINASKRSMTRERSASPSMLRTSSAATFASPWAID